MCVCVCVFRVGRLLSPACVCVCVCVCVCSGLVVCCHLHICVCVCVCVMHQHHWQMACPFAVRNIVHLRLFCNFLKQNRVKPRYNIITVVHMIIRVCFLPSILLIISSLLIINISTHTVGINMHTLTNKERLFSDKAILLCCSVHVHPVCVCTGYMCV